MHKWVCVSAFIWISIIFYVILEDISGDKYFKAPQKHSRICNARKTSEQFSKRSCLVYIHKVYTCTLQHSINITKFLTDIADDKTCQKQEKMLHTYKWRSLSEFIFCSYHVSSLLYCSYQYLNLILVVANLANKKWCKKPRYNDRNPGIWYSSESTLRELSNGYQHDRFRWFSKIFGSLCFKWMKVMIES